MTQLFTLDKNVLRDEVDKSNAGPDCRWFYALFSAVMLAQYVMVHVRGHCNYVLHKHENRWQGKGVSKLRTKRRVGVNRRSGNSHKFGKGR